MINGIIEKKTITIKAYRNRVDNKGSGPSGEFLAPIASWVLIDALPVGWAGPAFNANDNQRAVEEMTFICDGLTRH